MTVAQKRKILAKIQSVEADIEELRRCRTEIATNGYASATMSSGGGSKSYTRIDLQRITETIGELTKELREYRAMLASDGSPFRLRSILHTYC